MHDVNVIYIAQKSISIALYFLFADMTITLYNTDNNQSDADEARGTKWHIEKKALQNSL